MKITKLLFFLGFVSISSHVYGAVVCQTNDLGIELCDHPTYDSQICEAMSIWNSDLLDKNNKSYTSYYECNGGCSLKSLENAMKDAISQCRNDHGKQQNVKCVKVNCGLRILN